MEVFKPPEVFILGRSSCAKPEVFKDGLPERYPTSVWRSLSESIMQVWECIRRYVRTEDVQCSQCTGYSPSIIRGGERWSIELGVIIRSEVRISCSSVRVSEPPWGWGGGGGGGRGGGGGGGGGVGGGGGGFADPFIWNDLVAQMFRPIHRKWTPEIHGLPPLL